MNTLYESILNSTKSGKNHLPLHFSKEYTFEQADDAIEDYYDFYKILNKLSVSFCLRFEYKASASIIALYTDPTTASVTPLS